MPYMSRASADITEPRITYDLTIAPSSRRLHGRFDRAKADAVETGHNAPPRGKQSTAEIEGTSESGLRFLPAVKRVHSPPISLSASQEPAMAAPGHCGLFHAQRVWQNGSDLELCFGTERVTTRCWTGMEALVAAANKTLSIDLRIRRMLPVNDKSFETVSKDFGTDFAALRNDVANLTTLVADLAKTQAGTAKTSILNAVDTARGHLNDTTDVLSDKAGEMSNRARNAGGELESLVERNPLTALLFAIIGGLLLGMMSRSRS